MENSLLKDAEIIAQQQKESEKIKMRTPASVEFSLSKQDNTRLNLAFVGRDETFKMFPADNKKLESSAYEKVEKALEDIETAILNYRNILICGELGTGKKLASEFIKNKRGIEPFIHLNCTLEKNGLSYGDLFGCERGAHASAKSKSKGIVEKADTGYLDIDDLSFLSTDIQSYLAKVLSGLPFKRLGGKKDVNIKINIIAAERENIPYLIKNKKLRKDFYQHIKQVEIFFPSLDQRREDIPLLAHYFLFKAKMQSKKFCCFSEEFVEGLKIRRFSGNALEIKNIVETAVMEARRDETIYEKTLKVIDNRSFNFQNEKNQFERYLIIRGMEMADGNQLAASELMGVSKGFISGKLKEYNLSEKYKNLAKIKKSNKK